MHIKLLLLYYPSCKDRYTQKKSNAIQHVPLCVAKKNPCVEFLVLLKDLNFYKGEGVFL